MSKCISSKCQTAQFKFNQTEKIQNATFCQNPKGTNYCTKISKRIKKYSLLSKCQKSTQNCHEEDLAKVQKFKMPKSTKAVKRKDKICRGKLCKQARHFLLIISQWPLSELKVQQKTYFNIFDCTRRKRDTEECRFLGFRQAQIGRETNTN